jgi:serine/threonine protein phosphatase PrpC
MPADPSKQSLERLKTLTTVASEGKIDQKTLKSLVKEEFSRMKDLSEIAYKEGIARLLEITKQKQNVTVLAREQVAAPSVDLSSNTSMMSSARVRVKKLPKLTSEDAPSHLSDTPHPVANSTLLQNTMRASPQLQPIFTVTNSVARAGFKSRVGSIRGKPKLHNQDCILIKPNLQNVRGQYLFGVCDGHGAQGHTISEFIKEQFVPALELLLPFEARAEQIQKALSSAVDKISNGLASTATDIVFSGSTMLSVLISGSTLVCANVGNCRAFVGREEEKWTAVPLNAEHTVQNRKERERMLANNARIAVECDENGQTIGVEKIYMGNQDVPGLEITRSIGDKIGKFIGMISTPEIKTYGLQPEDKFVIIGTTGLWKVMTGTEAICIVRYSWESNKIEQSCEDLISEADRRWKASGSDKEDITAVVVYLNVS